MNADEATTEIEGAVNSGNNSQVIFDEYISRYNDIVIPGSIIIDGVANDLFRVFSDRTTALANFLNEYGWLMNAIKNEYGFDPITVDNYLIYQHFWEEYIYGVHFDSLTRHSFDDTDYKKCARFFDVFENNESNDRLIRCYEQLSNKGCEDFAELAPLLPYDSPFVEQYNRNREQVRLAGFNISDGITYATDHAVLGCGPALYSTCWGGDCTNFCSQILEAGGIPQNNTGNIYTGWWHTVTQGGTMSNPTFTHVYSKSFIFVDYFIPYWGPGIVYTNHVSFSYAIRPGSFIACDSDGDGDMNHMGFVTARKGLSGLEYLDYKVAQHTANYHSWTDASNNNWENQDKWMIVIY